MCVCIWYLHICITGGCIPRGKLLGHRACVCSALVDTAEQFTEVVMPIYITPASHNELRSASALLCQSFCDGVIPSLIMFG